MHNLFINYIYLLLMKKEKPLVDWRSESLGIMQSETTLEIKVVCLLHNIHTALGNHYNIIILY